MEIALIALIILELFFSFFQRQCRKTCTLQDRSQSAGNFTGKQRDTVWCACGKQIPILSEAEMPHTRASEAQLWNQLYPG